LKRLLLLLVCTVLLYPPSIEARRDLADEIVAVVDHSIILRSDILTQMAMVALQQGLSREDLLAGQGEKIFLEILENQIQELLLIARAKEDSVEVPRDVVEERVRGRIREMKDEYGAAAFARQVQEEGLTEREVRDRLRKRFRKDMIRQTMYGRMAQEVSVSQRDLQEYRTRNEGRLPPVYSLSHIMVAPSPSLDRVTEARQRIEVLLDRAKSGEDFAALAREYSEDPGSGPTGGDLGFFGRGDMVTEVEEVAYALRPGEISDIVKSDFGFHVLKLEEVTGERVRARHILITLQPSETDIAVAYQKAVRLYARVQSGESFADVAREASDHAETAASGGLLGTYSDENPPPGFVDVMGGMSLGDVSSPIQTEFGWHLVRINDEDDELEGLVRQSKIQDLFDRVMAETQDKLHVDIRLH
jgi:peptidyl-prolyl cis-trans isomerase SurA